MGCSPSSLPDSTLPPDSQLSNISTPVVRDESITQTNTSQPPPSIGGTKHHLSHPLTDDNIALESIPPLPHPPKATSSSEQQQQQPAHTPTVTTPTMLTTKISLAGGESLRRVDSPPSVGSSRRLQQEGDDFQSLTFSERTITALPAEIVTEETDSTVTIIRLEPFKPPEKPKSRKSINFSTGPRLSGRISGNFGLNRNPLVDQITQNTTVALSPRSQKRYLAEEKQQEVAKPSTETTTG